MWYVMSVNMDMKALFKLTYGLYIVGVEKDGKLSGCVINTVAQATAEPVSVLVTMMKTNYTTTAIKEKGSLVVSILSANTPMEVVTDFGYQSSRTVDKFKKIEYEIDINGNPYLKNEVIAYISLRVSQTVDLNTHYLFICEVEQAEVLSEDLPLTYAGYRDIKNGKTDSKAEVKEDNLEADKDKKRWTCSVCHMFMMERYRLKSCQKIISVRSARNQKVYFLQINLQETDTDGI
jgi:flavin reductase (DIM6/NTAB) family NADH-FMN oxidoreductase RutF